MDNNVNTSLRRSSPSRDEDLAFEDHGLLSEQRESKMSFDSSRGADTPGPIVRLCVIHIFARN